MSESIIFIPARMDSKRLPGKPLKDVEGKAVVHWTYDAAIKTEADYVFVVSGDEHIERYCYMHDIKFIRTFEEHVNGTSRCREAFHAFLGIEDYSTCDADVIIDWQGDEACVNPSDVDKLIANVRGGDGYDGIRTLCFPEFRKGWQEDPDVVKVGLTASHRAMWFCREPLVGAWAHLGVYGFTRAMLLDAANLRQRPLAVSQSLEQITWLQDDYPIYADRVELYPLAINSQKDLDEFRHMMKAGKAQNAD